MCYQQVLQIERPSGVTCRLLEEEAAWLQLRQQYSSMNQDEVAAAAAETPAAGADNNSQQAANADGGEPAPTADAAAVPTQTAADGAEAAGADAAAVQASAAADSPPGPVTAQGQNTLRGVSLKVEMVTALVAKMEHLISSAEAAARTLQVRWDDGRSALQVAAL